MCALEVEEAADKPCAGSQLYLTKMCFVFMLLAMETSILISMMEGGHYANEAAHSCHLCINCCILSLTTGLTLPAGLLSGILACILAGDQR